MNSETSRSFESFTAAPPRVGCRHDDNPRCIELPPLWALAIPRARRRQRRFWSHRPPRPSANSNVLRQVPPRGAVEPLDDCALRCLERRVPAQGASPNRRAASSSDSRNTATAPSAVRHAARSSRPDIGVKLEARRIRVSAPSASPARRSSSPSSRSASAVWSASLSSRANSSDSSKAARDRIWSPARKATHPRLNTASVTSNASPSSGAGRRPPPGVRAHARDLLRRANFAENRERGRGCPWVTQRSGPRDCVLTENSRAPARAGGAP